MNTFKSKHPYQWTQAEVAERIAAGDFHNTSRDAFRTNEPERLREINAKVAGLNARTNNESKNYNH